MSALLQPIEVMFAASMRGLMVLRRRGAFGTPERPRFYAAGDSVPWDIECRWPMWIPMQFCCDAETYFDGGYQVVRPLWRKEKYLIKVSCMTDDLSRIYGGTVLVIGSPTELLPDPRIGPKPSEEDCAMRLHGSVA